MNNYQGQAGRNYRSVEVTDCCDAIGLAPSALVFTDGQWRSMARVMIDEIKGSRGGELVTRHWVLELYLMT
jgi:hypothetical protein